MAGMTEQDLERMAKLVAHKTAEELLERLGIDVENVRDSQADFAHLRKQRLASEQIGKLTMRVVLSVFITGAFSLVLMGIQKYFEHKPF